MKGSVRLSQCMIVKNEEKNIECALAWGNKIAEEQIVVDTGSTDRTVEIAQAMGAKVFHFTWTDDFSAAKNFAIEQASGNWIAFLDADEYFTSQNVKTLMELLKTIENGKHQEAKPHIIRSLLVNLGDDGVPASAAAQDRIFRKLPSLRYHNRIHEILEMEEGGKLICYDAADRLTICHTGYSDSALKEKGKVERNLALLQKTLEEHPDDYDAKAYLGDAFLAASKFQAALDCFVDVFENGYKNPATMQYTYENASGQIMRILTSLMNTDKAVVQEWHSRAALKVAGQPDIDYWYGLYLYMHQQWKDVTFYLERALDKLNAYTGTRTMHISGDMEGVYCMLARSAQELHDDVKTVKYGVLALRSNLYLDKVLIVLFNLLQKEEDERRTAFGTINLLKKLYRTDSFRDKLFLFKCAKISGFIKAEEWICSLFTEEEKAEIRSR